MRTIERALAPLRRRLRLLVTRGVIRRVDDAAGLQRVQLTALAGETLDGVERIQTYGLTSFPHPQADCVILNVGASRSHPIIIAADDRRYRLHLQAGEVALYDDLGQVVRLGRGGIVIEAPQGLTINGDAVINGVLSNNGVNLTTHRHAGVQTGGGVTAGPQ